MQFEFSFEQRQEARKVATAEVIEKIKKLLRLGTSSNRHESELALQRAFELARKYQVEVAELDLDERTEKVTHEWFGFAHRASFLHVRACQIVIAFFRVKAVIQFPMVAFVGNPADIAIAHYAFQFIVGAGKRELRAFEIAQREARSKMSTGKRKQFLQGFIYGISSNLKKSEEQLVISDATAALVVAQEREREGYVARELCPQGPAIKVKEGKKNLTALMHGYSRGRDTQINQPLERGAASERLALR